MLVHTREVDIVSRQNVHLATLGEGEIFGEIGQSLKVRRTVTVIAKSSCVIRVTEDNSLTQKLADNDPAILAIMPGLALRLNASNDNIARPLAEL